MYKASSGASSAAALPFQNHIDTRLKTWYFQVLMREPSQHLDLDQRGLDHAPLAAADVLTINPPTLKDNTAWADRLGRAAARRWEGRSVEVPLELAPKIMDAARAGDGSVAVWVAWDDPEHGRLIDVAPPEPIQALGLAVDVGSTTLVMALVDLEKARVLDRLTMPNPQTEYGEDILTRVHFADKDDNRALLSRVLRGAIDQGLAELVQRRGGGRVVAAAMSGNTTMTHFLLGLSPATLIREPYAPLVNQPPRLTAGDLGLNMPAAAPVLVLPNKGAYFGGDLMAGLVASGLTRSEAPCLLVDVGTNAEVVLGQKDWLIGAAGAAGPALEGGVAAVGMIAGPGAVDRVRIDRSTWDVHYRTLGDSPPAGICGSGLIDLYAEMFLSGVIDFHAKLTLEAGHPRRLETDEGPAFVVVPAEEAAHGRPITISEVELDILTRSKAAMYTILNTVLLSVGLEFDQVDRFYVAGTFGEYIDPHMAVAVGMLPDIPLERYVSLGNASMTGTILALVSGAARREVRAAWNRLTYLEMNVNQDLMNRFSAARFIPHTERSLFPSVGTTIK